MEKQQLHHAPAEREIIFAKMQIARLPLKLDAVNVSQ